MPSLNVNLDFPDHPKTIRLVALIGEQAGMVLIRLWSYAGKFAAENGILNNCSVEEVERICGWRGRKGEAAKALISTGYLEHRENSYVVHNWLKHQGHIARYQQRGQLAIKARWERHRSNTCSIPEVYEKYPPSTTPSNTCSIPQVLPEQSRAEQNNSKGGGVPQGTVVGSPPGVAQSKPPLVEKPPEFTGESGASERENGTAFAEWPSHDEWCAAARMEGMTSAQVETEWAYQERKTPHERWRGIDRTRLRKHASFVLAKIRERTGSKTPASARGAARAFAHEVGEEAEIKILNKGVGNG